MLISAVTQVPFWTLPRSLDPTLQCFEMNFIRLLLILTSLFLAQYLYQSYMRASTTHLDDILPRPLLNVKLSGSVAPNPKSEIRSPRPSSAMKLFCVLPLLQVPPAPEL